MESDKIAETFSDALFTYLWFTENLISGTAAAETVAGMSEFIAEVAKAVVVLSALTVPSFNESMEDYFRHNDMSRRSVFTFLTKYCFDTHAESEDIFSVVLNTCTFVYRLVIFCQHRGHVEYIQFASMCWTEIFERDLKDDFYSKGGWQEFRMYVAENRYVPKDKETDQNAFLNFLDEINYLFPKLKISQHEEDYADCISVGACGPVEFVSASEEFRTLSPELLNSGEFCQSPGYLNSSSVFETSDDSVDEENNERAEGRDLYEPNLNQTSDDSEGSGEEMFQELVKASLAEIQKINSTPPSDDCVVCKSGELRTLCQDDTICPKHNPDSFYYWVTKSEEIHEEE